jgi:hypothetical protein
MRCTLEAKLSRCEDGSDVGFPESSRFGMTLECMEDGEDTRAVQFLAETMLVPFSIGVIHRDKSRCLGGWRVSIGILGVATIYFVVIVGG